ncbi:MAG: MBL fold metallo-hydrolase [Polyangiaceae bacterium]
MQIEFIGAAQTVTGSKHLIRTKHAAVLLDCGLFQGRRRESIQINQNLGIDPRELTAVVLSHAHIDHSGALPMLVKKGYDGPIFMTPATRDLCAVMLEDGALIQAQDARYINRTIERDGADMDPVQPLYTAADVVRVLERAVCIPYHRTLPVGRGVDLTFYDAGHVLGSAITALDVEEDGKRRRVVFTGDLGRQRIPILRDPEVAPGASVLISESTYGDRLHKPIEQMEDELGEVLTRTHARGGKLIIPSFALERAQEVLYAIKSLRLAGRMPKMPVYVDSPLTVKITDVFRLHPECFDTETRELIEGRESPFDFEDLRYVSDKEDSKAIDASDEPCVIISASGMCEAGRVVHHLKATLESEKNTIAIVGFQASHTLGRRIVERRKRVRIFGVERDLRAEVVVLNGFSAHADQADLLAYAKACREQGPLETIALVHGEPRAQDVLRGKLREDGFARVEAPAPEARIEV